MKAIWILIFATALSACASTSGLAKYEPSAVYHSQRPRDGVAECLMNRLGSEEMVPAKTVAGDVTTIGFTGYGGLTKPGIYLFTIKDEGSGSVTEMRTMRGLWKIKSPAAETCF